jgi:hypothetical protein
MIIILLATSAHQPSLVNSLLDHKLLQNYNNEIVISFTGIDCTDWSYICLLHTVSDIPGPNDLVHLKGPITENTITTTLQARFNANCYHVS